MDRINRSMSPTCQSQAIGSFSSLAVFHNAGGTQSNVHLGIMPTAAEDIQKLKKELRFKNAESDKERAILLQKNEQLESQLKETELRLAAQAQMYETMINSLKVNESASPSQLLVAQIQASERQAYEDEINELKEQRRRYQENAVDKEREYSSQLNDKEGFIRDMQMQVERVLIEKSQQLFQWEVDRKEFQSRLQMIGQEKEQCEAMIELKSQSKIGEVQMEMERLKLDHMREVERVKQECEHSLKEIRQLHEQEKQTLEYRLDRQSQDLKSLHHMVIKQDSDTFDTKESTQQHRQQLNQEISIIQTEVDGIKQQYENAVSQLTKEKENAEANYVKLQKQLEKLKNAPKQPTQVVIDLPLKQGESLVREDDESYANLQRQVKNLKQEVELLQQENEKIQEHVKKLRKEAIDMQEYTERLEANEKKLRQVLKDQSTIEQDQVVELRRQLNAEKKRGLEQVEVMSMAKEALERDNYKQASQINEKEDQIRNLAKELRTHEKKIYDIQSMFNSQAALNMSGIVGDQQMHMRQNSLQSPMLNGLGGTYIGQSQNNFSPRNPPHNMMMQGMMNNSIQLPMQSFVNQQPEYYDYQGLDPMATLAKSYSQSQLQNINNIHLQQQQFQQQQQILQNTQIMSQSICLSARGGGQQNIDMISNNSIQQPQMILKQQQSPRQQQQPKFILENSKSFTCLLKEIDEEEEKNISLPGSKIQQHERQNSAALSRKSRNLQNTIQNKSATNLRKTGGQMCTAGSSSVVMGTITSMQKTAQKPKKLSSSNSQASLYKKEKTESCHNSSIASKQSRKSTETKSIKQPNNISNEIKDLLNKLVSYQGGRSNNSDSVHSQTMIHNKPRHHVNQMSTDSMVELRSSNASNSVYIQGGGDTNRIMIQDYTPQTSRDHHEKGSVTLYNDDENHASSHHSDTPPRKVSSSPSSAASRSSSEETARHTSKDTILTIPGRRRRGRRYHEVNKSDVLTPNSPRRYQDYFKNKLMPSNAGINAQSMVVLSKKPKNLATFQGKEVPKTVVISNQPTLYQNHRYSPSNTKSIIDESQCHHQLSPSPEKPNKKQSVNEDYNLPMQQQLQNFMGSSKGSTLRPFNGNDSGTVLCGGASDLHIFKGQQHNLIFGFAPPGTAGSTMNKNAFDQMNNSMEDDVDIRPSQLDEFIESKENKADFLAGGSDIIGRASQHNPQQNNNISSSYITIGDDDPFLTGRFCDASTKQLSFKPSHQKVNQSHASSYYRKK